MPHPTLALVLRHLRRAARPADAGGPTDGQLLERFALHSDEAAFEALVQRHGPMVWNVCRRVLANHADADDAFQATFLVLVRKAGSIARRESAASWLHGVAYRIALDARAAAARRRLHERQEAAMAATEPAADAVWADLRRVLDEELDRLPEKYRAPLVLCYLEGKTNDEAADLLGWTRGTVAGRLSRARDLLRGRLTRRGLALSSAALAATLTENAASATVPAALTHFPWKAANGYAAARQAAPAAAAALAEGALYTMFLHRLKITALFMAALAVVAAGAGWFWQQALAAPATPPPPQNTVQAPPQVKPLVLNNDPAQVKADRPALVQGNTAFACDLYDRLRETPGNFVYSPYSISTALGMTYAGARGTTADEMAKVLHFTLPQERLHPAAGALARDLAGETEVKKRKYRLQLANALWGQKDFGFRDDFITLTRTSYGAGLHKVDFKNAREDARRDINDWVAKETKDKIKDLVQKDHLTPDTRLVLTNAIYFKADWEVKFNAKWTKAKPFQVAADKKADVPTMTLRSHFNHFDGGTFQMLELPYEGNEVSMLVLLPKKADGLPELEKALSGEQLAAWHKKLKEADVLLDLPKFKMTSAFELKKVLSGMGMPTAFQFPGADFSGMTGEPSLFIGQVVHKTMIDVNEEGTEAAGSTAVVMSFGGVPPPNPVRFNADHPFLFLVRHNPSGSILFVGRVADPTR
jgi:serpin B